MHPRAPVTKGLVLPARPGVSGLTCGQPPATAGRMLTVSPSATGVSSEPR